MNQSPQDLFRQAAEAEDGMSISAGGRASHLRSALETGRFMHVNLSAVPECDRPALVARIEELVARAGTKPEALPEPTGTDAK